MKVACRCNLEYTSCIMGQLPPSPPGEKQVIFLTWPYSGPPEARQGTGGGWGW